MTADWQLFAADVPLGSQLSRTPIRAHLYAQCLRYPADAADVQITTESRVVEERFCHLTDYRSQQGLSKYTPAGTPAFCTAIRWASAECC